MKFCATRALPCFCLATAAALCLTGLVHAGQADKLAIKQGDQVSGTFVKYEQAAERIQIRTDDQVLHAIPIHEHIAVRVKGQEVEPSNLEQGSQVTIVYSTQRSKNQQQSKKSAQDQASTGPKATESISDFSLAYPTGDRATSVLLVEMSGPEKTRVGQPSGYQVKVTNLTKNILLENVQIHPRVSGGVEIISRSTGKAQGKQSQQNQQRQKQPQQAQETHSTAHEHQAGASQPWQIDWLEPGETKRFEARLVGHEQGKKRICFQVTYEPTLCLTANFVQPELELVKQAPDEVDICETITFHYRIKNTGTAVAKGLVIRDTLPQGMRRADAGSGQDRQAKQAESKQAKKSAKENKKNAKQGNKGDGQANVITFDVGDLKPGAEREFTAHVLADRVGTFRSAATAVSDRDVRVQSQQTDTLVQQANLAVNIDGEDAGYVNQTLTYQLTVTNRGGAPAQHTKLEVDLGEHARLVDTSQGQGQRKDGRDQQANGKSGDRLTWNLETLGPGESKQISLTVAAQKKGDLKIRAMAEAQCARDIDTARAKATMTTQLLTLPALRLAVVDQKDPVRVGDTTTYKITVTNQGTGRDQNVRISAQLPDAVEFVEAGGITKGQMDGGTLTFQPIKAIEPGEKVEWTIQVRAKQDADVRTRVELRSDYLNSPVPSVEPTRLIK